MRPIGLLGAVCLLAAQPALAQDQWTGRFRVAISGGAQADTVRLAQQTTLQVNLEPAPVWAGLPNAAVPFFDAGLTVRLGGNLGASLALSYLSKGGTADVTAAIPHPFYFGRPRTIEGRSAGVSHAELGTHAGLTYLIVSRRIDLALSGGATFFKLDQSLVSDVDYTESFPYDTAAFSRATLELVSASKTGYHAGADVAWKLSPRWGVGGLLRFSRARVPLTLEGEDAGTVPLGGLQAGGGVRVMF